MMRSLILGASVSAMASAVGEYAECAAPVDVVFLQDATQTYGEDLPIILDQMPSLVNAIRADFPGTYLGLASFRDKPIEPLGWPDDYIYRLHSGLTLNDTQFIEAWRTVAAGGGYDLPEDTYEGMLATFQDPLMGWHPKGEDIEGGEVRAHITVLLTDAGTHLAGDAATKVHSIVWQPHDGIVSAYDVANPLIKDYPSWEQVRDAVKSEPGNYILFLVTEDVRPSWDWANGPDMLDQPAEFVQTLSVDSNNLETVVMNALKTFGAYHCDLHPTYPPNTNPEVTTSSGGDQCCSCCDGEVGSGKSKGVDNLVARIKAEMAEELEARMQLWLEDHM